MSESGHETKGARQSPTPATVCGQCRKEIPTSAATTHEGADYVRYFCGNGCLQDWRGENATRKK